MLISNALLEIKIIINLQFRNVYERLNGVIAREIKKAYNCEKNINIINHFYT